MPKLDHKQISDGLGLYRADGIRQNIISVNAYKLINDCYNSSPQSAIAALKVLCDVKAKRKIAVLGDIAELGDRAEEFHRSVGKSVNDSNVDILITVGNNSLFIASEAKDKEHYHFDSSEPCADFLKTFVQKDDALLIKGSRCMKMECIAEKLI